MFDNTLEENARKRSDEESLVAPTTHIRLSYPDLLSIKQDDVVIVGPVAFMRREVHGDCDVGDVDLVVPLGDHHVEELQGAGGILNWGIRYIGGQRQFLMVSGGGISDDLGVDKSDAAVRREVDRRWNELMEDGDV